MTDQRVSADRGLQAVRVTLIVLGALGLFYGAWVLVTTVSPKGLYGLAIWLVGALVLHDGILGPVLWLANRLLRSVGRRLPLAVLALSQVAVLVGALMTGLVLPEIFEQSRIVNKTVVPLNYGLGLIIMWALLLGIIVLGGALLVRRANRADVAPRPRP